MPDLGISEIIALASLIAGGVSTGVSAHEASQSRDAQNKASQVAKQAAAQQELLQKRQALIAAGPNVQSQTGGSLTGPAGQSFTDLLAGLPGQTGGSAPTTPSPTTSGPSANPYSTSPGGDALTAFLGQNQGGNSVGGFSGGWQPPQPSGGGGRFSLTDFLQGA